MQEIHKIEPASEEWWLFRKPISEVTITDNVLRWGTGGLNIDGCRVNTEPSPSVERRKYAAPKESIGATGWKTPARPESYNEQRHGETLGRWPANVVHDGSDEVVGMFPDVKAVGRYKEPLQDCKTAYPDGSCNATSYDIKNTAGVRRRSHMYSGQDGSAARFSTQQNQMRAIVKYHKENQCIHYTTEIV